MSRLPRRLDHGEEATLAEHLDELRGRLFVALGALAVTTIGAFTIHTRLLTWLNRPLPAGHRHLLTLGVAEPFTVSLTVSVYAGVVLASPVILWQFWAFFAPAFEPTAERKMLGLAAFAATLGVGASRSATGSCSPAPSTGSRTTTARSSSSSSRHARTTRSSQRCCSES